MSADTENRPTVTERLCDDDGMVRNNKMEGAQPYPCPGVQHYAGTTIVCNNPIHKYPVATF